MKINRILRMPEPGEEAGGGGGGGGNTPPDWRASIPEDLRTSPALKDIKDVGSLAKSYVNAQSLIGADKIARPNPKWTDTQWSDFYNAGGRPTAPDKYAFKTEGLHESIKIDDTKMAATKKVLFDAGLSEKQASAVMGHYFGTMSEQMKAVETARQTAADEAMNALKEEYGDDFQVKIDVAKSVVKKFGGDELAQVLNDTGLGNNALFIKLFAGIGEALLDDTERGSGDALLLPNASKAIKEIEQLRGDQDFLKVFTNRSAPGHKEALARWEKLHEVAYPNDKA